MHTLQCDGDEKPVHHTDLAGLICMVKTWRKQVECGQQSTQLCPLTLSGIDMHEQRGLLPVVGAAPTIAEGTASIEPAGRAETASATRPKVLEPGVKFLELKVRRARVVWRRTCP